MFRSGQIRRQKNILAVFEYLQVYYIEIFMFCSLVKLRTYAYLKVPENPENPKAEVARIAADRAMYSNEYFHVVGIKSFLDGVIEARTGWQLEDYHDQPGYHGLDRVRKAGQYDGVRL